MDKSRIDKIAWWIPNKKLRAFFRDFCNEHNKLLEDNKKLNNKIASNINIIDELYYILNENIYDDSILYLLLTTYDYNYIYKSIHKLWYEICNPKYIVKILDFYSKRPDIWNKINNRYWLIYISVLYENCNFEIAKDVLFNYIKKYKLLDIHRFLLVSELALKIGITSDDIEKAVFIKSKLDKSINDNMFENTIKGKTVAVVGNGPQEIGKSKGEEIDSHDIVIRFNNFKLEGFEKDYGNKTNIWVRNGTIHLQNEFKKFDNFCCWEPDFYHFIIPDHVFYKIYEELKVDKIMTTYITHNMHFIPKNIGKVLYISSGGLIVYNVLNLNKDLFSIKNIYGFSFIEEDLSYSNYHFYESSSDIKVRNFDDERFFLRKLFMID